MNIITLKYGETVLEEGDIFKGARMDVYLPISFTIYLIQTDNKNILVDAGCDDGAGFKMSIFKNPTEVLEEYGLTPADITDVIITHSHYDHTQAIKYYKNATIHVQRDEYELTKKRIPEGFRVHLFDNEFSLEENIIIKKIGGHSVGSCIVLADNYVFCGDECYYRKNLTDRVSTGISHNEAASEAFVTEYGKDAYLPLLFHDPDIMRGSVGYMKIK